MSSGLGMNRGNSSRGDAFTPDVRTPDRGAMQDRQEEQVALPEIVQPHRMYHGPLDTTSAWANWERSEGENQRRIRYCVFRNRQWGTTIELDANSTGIFKYARDDRDDPQLVEQSGRQRKVDSFSAPRIVFDLKIGARPGIVRMTGPVERYGSWTATVDGARIVITQASTTSNLIRMRLVLMPEAFECYGQSASHTTDSEAFIVEAGSIFAPLNAKVVQDERAGRHSGGGKPPLAGGAGGDVLGVLRRSMCVKTSRQRLEHECAEAFLKLTPGVRNMAVRHVELAHLELQKLHGIITKEVYQRRLARIDSPCSVESPLRAADALQSSPFVDPARKTFLPSSEFAGFDGLSWYEKLSAAAEAMEAARGSLPLAEWGEAITVPDRKDILPPTPVRRESSKLLFGADSFPNTPGQAGSSRYLGEEGIPHTPATPSQRKRAPQHRSPIVEGKMRREMHGGADVDSELGPNVRSSQGRQDLRGGRVAGGLQQVHTTKMEGDLRDAKMFQGKETRQLYEECEVCGRKCQDYGTGLCNKCKALEREKFQTGTNDILSAPDTYYGEARYLLGHAGFTEYIPVPLRSEQTTRNKIDQRFSVQTPADLRGALTDYGELPKTPYSEIAPDDLGSEVRERRKKSRQGRADVWNRDKNVSSTERTEVHKLVLSNKLEEVKVLIQAELACFTQDPIWEQRDKFGNTPIIVAAQQGHKRMCKLLTAAACNVSASNTSGNSALHYAHLYGHQELYQYLVRKGGDETLCNRQGLAPPDMVAK